MKASRLLAPLTLVVLLCTPALLLAKKSISDYVLRLHIYETHWNHNGWGYHAYGRANLFDEQGVPHGVEFTYDCADHLMGSNANEAYPAKWKKPGQSIEVVFGVIGAKPGSFGDCEFKIAQKQFVYAPNGGGTESAQEFLANHQKQVPTIGPATVADVPVSANEHHPY